MFFPTAFADAAPAGGSDWIQMLMPMAIVFAVMYFMVFRPQSKKAKDHQNMLAALRRNDRVLINGGIIGKVTKVGEQEVGVEIAPGVEIQVVRAMISQVLSKTAVVEESVVTPMDAKKTAVKKSAPKKSVSK